MRRALPSFVRKIIPVLIAIVWIATAQVVLASSIMDRLNNVATNAGFNAGEQHPNALAEYVGFIIKASMSLVGVIFVAQMVYAGYLWMTGRDEAEQIDKAKHIIRRSIIGLAIIFGSWAVTNFVIDRIYRASQGTV